MENESQLSEGALILLLEKKLSLLAELFQFSQKQMSLIDEIELEEIIGQKDQCIEALKQADTVIAIWEEEHPRDYHDRERQLLQYIQTGLEDILALEQQFEKQLQKEKSSISTEMGLLRDRSQVRNYLGASRVAGKNLSFRR